MLIRQIILTALIGIVFSFSTSAYSNEPQINLPEITTAPVEAVTATDSLDEIDPFDPNIEQILNEFDQMYEEETGLSAHPEDKTLDFSFQFLKKQETCVRENCEVWAQIVRSTQTMYLYVRGNLEYQWKVSTGIPGRGTPNMDMHPNGRIYDRYTSTKFPGGNYKGLGNMPYAVFIKGGFAIHGTPEGNWKNLGKRASHGCIRIHPDNGYYFNRLVRQTGVDNVWITVQE